ncbi:carboxymuconolactone decarboxylase family protein [bacterium]|nr:carboxymuconolactone decarboxylase family protein [bacterium]
MQRITPISESEATGHTSELYGAVKSKLGLVPNMVKTMAASTPVLEGYLSFSTLVAGTLDARERELISLAVAEVNGCEYCASAHSALAKMVGLKEDVILAARQGLGTTPRQRAVVELATAIARDRGRVPAEQIEAAKAELTEAQIAEVVANVALNFYTNLFNNVAETEVDFPKVEPVQCAC